MNTKTRQNGLQATVKMLKEISGQDKTLTIPRVYLRLLNGDHKGALFLSQCVYWTSRHDTPDDQGWFFHTYQSWWEELLLTKFEVTRVANILDRFLEKRITRKPNQVAPVCYYRARLDQIAAAILELNQGSKVKKLDYRENGKSRNLTDASKETLLSNPLVLNEYLDLKVKQGGGGGMPENFENFDPEIIAILDQIGVFRNCYDLIKKSGWTKQEILDTARDVIQSGAKAPGGAFIHRVKTNNPKKPKRRYIQEIATEDEDPPDEIQPTEKLDPHMQTIITQLESMGIQKSKMVGLTIWRQDQKIILQVQDPKWWDANIKNYLHKIIRGYFGNDHTIEIEEIPV